MTNPTSEASEPEAVVMCWIPCTDWNDLPEGTNLVKVDCGGDIQYQVARALHDNPMVVVGHYFYFDAGKLLAYSPFEKYDT